LPLVVKTVLLPFKGRIIYDGFFKRMPFVLNSSVSKSLKEVYMKVKQREAIVSSLTDPDLKKRKRSILTLTEEENVLVPQLDTTTDTKRVVAEIETAVNQLKKVAPKGIERSACSVLALAVQLVGNVLENPDDKTNIKKHAKLLHVALGRLT